MQLIKYGNIYKWGNGNTKVELIEKITTQVIDISAGINQSVIVTEKGTITGYGHILNGELEGINNAIKTVVTKDKIVILTTNGESYDYKAGALTKIDIPAFIVDIAASRNTVMYQTSDEEIFSLGANTYGELGLGNTEQKDTPTLVNLNDAKAFTMTAGYNNTYIIETRGMVYASGNNEYGAIGNGTRKSTNQYTLVGDRRFEVEPMTKTMKIGDKEEIAIKGNPFNVFNENNDAVSEYTLENDNEEVLTLAEKSFTAIKEGIAHITIVDNITKEEIKITRIVVAQDKDRIEKITVNKQEASLSEESAEDEFIYKVKIITNEDTGDLIITTKDKTDRISIDGGNTWGNNGKLEQKINLTDKFTHIPIKVGIQNNSGEYPEGIEEEYTLVVEKITDDIGLKKITVTSKDGEGNINEIIATPVSTNRYEVIVDEGTDISNVKGITNSEYSFVSIEGEEYTLKEQLKDIDLSKELSKEVRISVKSEAGREVEYTLVIYKKNLLSDLISLTVNGAEATKVSEGAYAITVDRDVNIANIKAEVASNLVKVSIEGNEFKQKENEISLNLVTKETRVLIKTKTENGETKEYTLDIYRSKDSLLKPNLSMLLVNGVLIEPEDDGVTYIAYLPSAETNAYIRAIAEESQTKVKIADQEEEIGESQRMVALYANESKYDVVLTKEDESLSDTYKVIIRRAEADTSLEKVFVSNKGIRTEANKIDKLNYTVKIPSSLNEIDVIGITKYAKAKIKIGEDGSFIVHEGINKINVPDKTNTVKITVQSEDESLETEYTLTIEKESENTNLEKVIVEGEEVIKAPDGKYHYYLSTPKTSVTVIAKTEEKSPNDTYIKLGAEEYELFETTRDIEVNAKEIKVPIKVKAENGKIQEHILIIEGLPDNTNIKTVEVNGKIATYIEGKNRYEIRSRR